MQTCLYYCSLSSFINLSLVSYFLLDLAKNFILLIFIKIFHSVSFLHCFQFFILLLLLLSLSPFSSRCGFTLLIFSSSLKCKITLFIQDILFLNLNLFIFIRELSEFNKGHLYNSNFSGVLGSKEGIEE